MMFDAGAVGGFAWVGDRGNRERAPGKKPADGGCVAAVWLAR